MQMLRQDNSSDVKNDVWTPESLAIFTDTPPPLPHTHTIQLRPVDVESVRTSEPGNQLTHQPRTFLKRIKVPAVDQKK